METLFEAILPRTSWFDIRCPNVHALEERPQALGIKLWPIVAANELGNATDCEQVNQDANHILARDSSIHFQSNTLTSVLVNDQQNL